MSFVHLHTHSHYSLLDGLTKVPELIQAVKKMNMPAVALTDHGNLYGAIEFYQEAKKNGIQPIIGLEAYVAPTSIEKKDPQERPFHLILLAKNATGYEHLVQLITIAHLEGFYSKPRIDFALLEKYREGLIVLSGCLSGEVARAILHKGMEEAKIVAQKYYALFGDDYFLEVQHNPTLEEQQKVNDGLLHIHNELGIPLVGTADSHYVHVDDREAQDALLCIQTKTTLADERRLTMRHEDYSLASSKVMKERFRDFPGAAENTLVIASRVDIDLELGKMQIPHYPLPAEITPEQELERLCIEGIEKRYPQASEQVAERLQYELDIISKTGFASYFLIVQDFINWAKQQGIAVGPGRGSAAGSIVAYLTGITDIDPIRYELLFERFLNPERISQPDIDTDFADARRDDVLRYVEEKYGKDHVAQIVTFGTMAARAAVRDVGRALGFSYSYCDRIAKLIPMFMTLDEAIKHTPELSEMMTNDTDAQRLMGIAKKLEGVVRHTSTHACAVVITKDPLSRQVPLQLDQEGNTITQYSMNPIDSLGLLKMDFLGLKNLTVIEHALDIIRATTGKQIDIEHIPLDDKPTFALLKRADTIGVFQLESSGMRRYLKQLKPTEIEDIIAMVSLYRPGPMDFIPEYIAGKQGKRTITYLHEKLQPILQKTYGIAVYQEQIMEVARQLAGYTYGEADVLRKAVGKKNKALLDEQEQKMISGMIERGISAPVAKRVWEFILPFARYGFNRSHAACYAMIAYRTAYLKANYPAQFMAALLTADEHNTDRVALEVQEAQRMGMKVLPPDINESFATFSVVKETLDTPSPRLRFGLRAIKQVGNHLIDVIIGQRKKHGPFTSLEDFFQRTQDKDLNKKSLESLIKTGTFDSFGERNELLGNTDALLQFTKRLQEEKKSGQTNLFGGSSQFAPKIILSPIPPVSSQVSLQWEKELLGLYVSGHPLAEWKDLLERHSIPFCDLKDHLRTGRVQLIGMVTSLKRIITKSGETMIFAGFADHTGEIEALVFPKVYQEYRLYWNEQAILQCEGKLDNKDGSIKLLVETVKPFRPAETQEKVVVHVPKQMKKSLFEEISTIMKNHEGTLPVFLDIEGKQMDTRLSIHSTAITELQNLLGQEAVVVIRSQKGETY